MSPLEAARVLGSGGLVIVPTETVFGIAADASRPDALSRLWRLVGGAERPVLAWHAPDAGRVRHVVQDGLGRPLPSVHERVLERLTPGAVLLAFALPPEALQTVRSVLGVEAGVIDDGRELLVRVPSHPAASSLLTATEGPVVMAGVAPPTGGKARDSEEARAVIASLHPGDPVESLVDGLIDAPPPPLGRPSTLVRLMLRTPEDARGMFEVAREGVYDRAFIERRLAKRVLFVCTGNTCRSPMAAALAREAVGAPAPGQIPVVIDSAGVSTHHGAPATPEAVEALRGMGVRMGAHASKPLTREMLREADVVYAMTRSHAEAARQIEPAGAHKVRTLDPSGADIDDPIGGPLSVYESTARAMRGFIAERLREEGWAG